MTRPPSSPVPGAWKLVALAVFAAAWGGNEFTPMMVFYRAENVFSPVFVDSLLAAYAVGIAGSLLIAGPLSDRLGRKPLMLPAPLLAIAGSVLIALGEVNAPLMAAGRVLSGVSLGLTMTAGGAWIKELSSPSMDPQARPGAGAKRATMSLTGGFGLGALVAGLLAQWGPAPGQLPYVLHGVLAIVSFFGLLRVPETRPRRRSGGGSLLAELVVDSARHPRFLYTVVPVAPWVFGCAGVAYVIMPSLAQGSVSAPVAFSAGVTALALSCGFAIQQGISRIGSPVSARAQILALCLVIVGMSAAAWVAAAQSVVGTVVVGVILGTAYGLCLISGLTEVQRIAGPDDLGGLTAIFYVITYIGFFFPMILTKLSQWLTYPQMLGFGVVMAALALAVVLRNSRRHMYDVA